MNDTVLISGGLVADPLSGTVEHRDLLVKAGRIDAIARPGTLVGETVVDASRRMVVPGLINSHTHGHMSLNKGMAERWMLETSLSHASWLAGRRSPETIYASTLLAAAEMLKKGATACFDLVYEYPLPTVEGFFACARAYADAGIRARLSPMISDLSFFQAIPGLADSLPDDLKAAVSAPIDGAVVLDAVRAIFARRDELPAGIELAIAPTIPHHCSETFLLASAEIAAEFSVPIHMHVAESRLQRVTAFHRYDMSPIAYLKDLGLLGPEFVAAHAVWLDPDDLDMIAAAGAKIAHVPASNMRLGVGFAHVRPMLERGITVGLATDGANSSDALDMFRAMRLSSFGARLYGDPAAHWPTALETFRMGTMAGAALIGWADAGRIAVGADADLVFLDLDHIDFLPLNDPLNQLITSAGADTITDVMVGGRFRLRDGVLTAPVFDDLSNRVSEAVAQLRTDNRDLSALASRLAPFAVSHAERLMSAPLAIERFIRPERGSFDA
ncbi:amidohydrolase family protein [Martelella sp. HB161492]|uniref:amidohydrolase family protein n=1 Tax=Martelella sp. HB161492 TaxID=2720726 RepID=UPI0015905B51|nr:amidohydrolase family protein [Martelella sp. HB161492]